MQTWFRCDQCAHEEQRSDAEEPALCPVCGYERWQALPDPIEAAESAPENSASRHAAPGSDPEEPA